MKTSAKSLGPLLLVSLAGCANLSQQDRLQAFKNEMQDADRQCLSAYGSAKLAPIVGKVRTNQDERFSLPMLQNKSTPTSVETNAILELDHVLDFCAERRLLVVGKYYPAQYRQAIQEMTAEAKVRRAQLYGGEISYAEYNKSIQGLELRLAGRLQDLDKQSAAARAQDQAARDKASADAVATSLLMMQSSQPIRSPATNIPTQTNCTASVNRISCMSW